MEQIKLGKKEDLMTEKEIENVLYAKNSRSTLKNGQVLAGDRSLTYGLAYDIWGKGVLPDVKLFVNKLKSYFGNLFEWNGKDVSEEFKLKLEHILFQHGRCAVVKMPNGEFFPVEYNWNEEDEDFYGNPEKITIITNNKFNGRIFKKDNFVIIKNNSEGENQEGKGTLFFAYERLRQINRSIIDVDNASIAARTKLGAKISPDDNSLVDIENAYHSSRVIIPTGNADFGEEGLEDLTADDRTDVKINSYHFQVNNLLQLLGLSVNEGNIKAERMSELEVAKGDKFAEGEVNLIILDMYQRRQSKIEALKELGMDINLWKVESEVITEKDVNGELNKEKVGVDNEETD